MEKLDLTLLKNLQYCGGGYFRDKTVPKNHVAQIFHAPELISSLVAELEQLRGEAK